jgi:lipid II:glycine glycyltransferase (peptidoglycan interpeptide bridge formation enzyme)
VKSTIRQARDEEIAGWDELIATNPAGGEVFQTKAFADLKRRQGWRPEFWVYETSFGAVYTLVLARRIPRIGRILYAPRGPSVTNLKQWREICRLNRQHARDAVMIKMEPPIARREIKTLPNDLTHVANVQGAVTNTVIINLNQSKDDLWSSFRQRARRAIRGGKKEQLIVRMADWSPANFNFMCDLYKETARRANSPIRHRSYYRTFWREFMAAGAAKFFFCKRPGDERPIAGAFIQWSGQNALYKDGGSRRDVKAHFSHLLHWQIMLWLAERGVRNYDLGGAPPSDQLDDSTHAWAGLATFKLSFGAAVTDFVGAYDQILKPAEYQRWSKLERLWRGVARRTPYRDIY